MAKNRDTAIRDAIEFAKDGRARVVHEDGDGGCFIFWAEGDAVKTGKQVYHTDDDPGMTLPLKKKTGSRIRGLFGKGKPTTGIAEMLANANAKEKEV